MNNKYVYGHRPGKRRRTRVFIALVISFLIIAIIVGTIGFDLYKNNNSNKVVSSAGLTVGQSNDVRYNQYTVNEPLYTFALPGGWKEINRQNNKVENSITWQATEKGNDNRYLKLYLDIIPTTRSVNKLLPVTARDDSLSHGDISENCASFTGGGTFDTSKASRLSDTPAKYQSVDFICDLPRVTDNEIGSGSVGSINSVTVKGGQGDHKYFFIYTDRNIQPDYTIFYNALDSFRAK